MERDEKLAFLDEYRDILGESQYEALRKRLLGESTSNKENVALNRLKKRRFEKRDERLKREIQKAQREHDMLDKLGGIMGWG